jgi:membrane associated rhomboid family serine protease
MSIYSRDYMKDGDANGRRGPASWSVVTRLLVLNLVIYVFQHLLFYSPERNVLALSIDALLSWHLWTPITYQFAHANFWHLLGNMIGLFFLGRLLLDLTGARHILRLYFLGGLAGGALQLIYNILVGPDALVIGASASVLSIIIALATLAPNRSIHLLLFFLIPIRLTMRQIALLLVIVNAVTFLMGIGGGGTIAVMAHVGGMLFGWAYIRYFYAGKPARRSRSSRRRRPGGGKFGIRILKDGESPSTGVKGGSPTPFVNRDVDAILDKINEHGFQSLSEEEKQILEQSSKRLSKRIDRDS